MIELHLVFIKHENQQLYERITTADLFGRSE